MKQALKRTIKSSLRQLGVGITSAQALDRMMLNASATHDIELLLTLPHEQAPQLLDHLRLSKSQLRQDLFVLAQLGFKRDGFFVEFGATNGIDLSNTYLLEQHFGWKGILAEPAQCWHHDLQSNRKSTIDKRCVWTQSGQTLTFNEVSTAELSTIESFSGKDDHKASRQDGKSYLVQTISLNDLLSEHQAPATMDYLSIDTEGSEYDILSHLDFNRYRFRVITCEHNFTPMRTKIHDLLTSHGYRRVHELVSKFDDWYVMNP